MGVYEVCFPVPERQQCRGHDGRDLHDGRGFGDGGGSIFSRVACRDLCGGDRDGGG